jgi:hypothetical protein
LNVGSSRSSGGRLQASNTSTTSKESLGAK